MDNETIDFDYTDFKKNLRSLLESKGYTLISFRDASGISASATSRYLSGIREPQLSYIIKIAQFFGVSIDWLLGLNGEKYELVSPENRELIYKYSIAKEADKQIIQLLLSKYEVKQ